ncbi:calcium-binding protein [Endozoicomonas sp.]|uniref:calcium-binding protein n=1 Tax=Endozoicomonas sp. TaxID=1892382 RepID=UPI002886AEBF|nr:calcium-binding protein [Endozoicomonas sp.]
MSKPEDPEREHRIDYEIVVDCYDELERSTGWYCYLEDRLAFPFAAECCQALTASPLKTGERVMVTGMADQDYCTATMLVQVRWQGHSLAVPLSQLEAGGDEVNEDTVEAMGDWHYWIEQAFCF